MFTSQYFWNPCEVNYLLDLFFNLQFSTLSSLVFNKIEVHLFIVVAVSLLILVHESVYDTMLLVFTNWWYYLEAGRGQVISPDKEKKFLVGIYQDRNHEIGTNKNCSDVTS